MDERLVQTMPRTNSQRQKDYTRISSVYCIMYSLLDVEYSSKIYLVQDLLNYKNIHKHLSSTRQMYLNPIRNFEDGFKKKKKPSNG